TLRDSALLSRRIPEISSFISARFGIARPSKLMWAMWSTLNCPPTAKAGYVGRMLACSNVPRQARRSGSATSALMRRPTASHTHSEDVATKLRLYCPDDDWTECRWNGWRSVLSAVLPLRSWETTLPSGTKDVSSRGCARLRDGYGDSFLLRHAGFRIGGNSSVVLIRGHGNAVVGASLPWARFTSVYI